MSTRAPVEKVIEGERSKILLDVPSGKPTLRFKENARALKEIIAESDPQFAIGIFGGWGSGKTTLMQAIEAELDPTRAIPVRFSAWRYEREEHLIVPLLDTVREALLSWAERPGTNSALARKTASQVGRVMKSIVAGLSLKAGIPQTLEVSFDANKALESHREMWRRDSEARVPRSFYHASFRALEASFAEFVGPNGQRRIVVFIDDLDRSLPESALQVLESMKLFFDLKGFVFVVGLDRKAVQDFIDSKWQHDRAGTPEGEAVLGRVSGEEYIKKIFQLPFRLAPVSINQLPEFLGITYDEAGLSDGQRQELKTLVEPHLDAVVGDAAVNPREIKRYINSYTLLRKTNPDLEPDPILALQTISFRPDWNDCEDAINEYRQLFIDALRRQVVERKPHALKELDPELGKISPELLEYVGLGQPGHALVNVANIDAYIYSGEAVRSTHNTALLDALWKGGRVRIALRDALREQRIPTLEEIGKIRTLLSQAESGLSESTGTLPELISADIQDFRRVLDALEQRVDAETGFDVIKQGLEKLDELAARISQRLRRLYRAGGIGASQVPHEVTMGKNADVASGDIADSELFAEMPTS